MRFLLVLPGLIRSTANSRAFAISASLGLAVLSVLSDQPGYAQAKPGVERLYILNCGEGVAGDISRWSPGVNAASPWSSSTIAT